MPDDHRRAQLREIDADMRAIKNPWLYRAIENPQLYWAEYALLFGFLAIVIFLVWLHLVTYPEPGLFSDVATSVSNAPGP